MAMASLRRRCEAALRGLEVPSPFDIQLFCTNISLLRGRPLDLRRLPIEADVRFCGVYAATPARDYVYYPRGTSLLHQEHIILHELMHLIRGHKGLGAAAPPDSYVAMLPGLDPDLVALALGRSGYASPEESEAEMMASLILERAQRRPDPEPRSVADRIELSFG